MEVNSSDKKTGRIRRRQRAKRRLFSGLNSMAAVLLVVILTLMLNYLSSRHYIRYDWSAERFYELSGKTKALLASLKDPVRVTVFIQPGHELHHLIYDDAVNLLREYVYAARGQLTVDRVDPDRHLGQAEALMGRLQLDEPNVIIFEFGDRFRVVQAEEVAEIDYQPLLRGERPNKISFKGEQIFTAAIFSLVAAEPPRVYFLQGHGERDFDDHDEYVGLSRMGQAIRRDNIELAPFSFVQRSALPEDADALIVAGPARAYATAEIERITAFAQRSGRVLLMLNAETDAGFAPLLRYWGIDPVNNLLIDPARTLSGFDVIASSYGTHPVTESLGALNTVFFWPRALPLLVDDRDEAIDKPAATALVLSSGRSWAERDVDQRPFQFDEARDIRGPLPLAVAVDRVPGASAAMQIQPTRTVIFGNIDFISNSGLSGGNADLFLNALNWMLERDHVLDIAPRPVEEIRLLVSSRHLRRLFRVVVVGIPATALLVGLVVWWIRRR